ncbi:MAG: PPC domain-containing protein, partial [Candidatus Omnitrophica bacterium]|nr:PPC domain-containing protein [Candidatus Omnitrophota bacterium]
MSRFIIFLIILVKFLYSQTSQNQPSIGYVYPSGGKIGSSFEIVVGGQNLRGVKDIYFSSDEIKVESFIYIPVLSPQQRQLLTSKIKEIVKSRYIKNYLPKEEIKMDVKLPENPLLTNLENKTDDELKQIIEIFLTPFRREQIKRSIQEKVLIRVNISPNIQKGVYQLRLITSLGITNPLNFYISDVLEVKEDFEIPSLDILKPKEIVYDTPIIINGQILPGDIDRFYFNAKKGQKIIIELKARDIIPYMADAVPGWFQATLTLYDSFGNEIAYSDDYYFNPDPLIFFEVYQDGKYMVKVKDALYRGREDFVYRLFIGEREFNKTYFDVIDYNFYNLPEIGEKEPNDKLRMANEIKINQIVNGVIEKQGDIDIFKLKLHKNFKFVAEVYARKTNSPLDAYICLMDSSGKILVSNDDYYDKNFDLITHHADPYIYYEIPKDGIYYLKILDIQNNGGKEYFYHLRVSETYPDFSIFVFPSSINIITNNTTFLYAYAFRKDGFNGEIRISIKNGPKGLILNGGRIPEGKSKVVMTITATDEYIPSEKVIPIQIEGNALIDGKLIKKIAKPSEEIMQAFAYYHFIPSSELLLYTRKWKFQKPIISLNEEQIVKIPSGGKTKIEYKINQSLKNEKIIIELREYPEGISIGDVKIENGILSFEIKADEKIKKGYSDNLLFELFSEISGKDGK